jgi:hypothetical protein
MRNNDQAREACLSGEIEAMILRVCRGYGIATLELGMRTWDDPPASDGSIQWLCEQVYSRGVEAGREHCSICWNLGNTVPTSQEPLVAGASSLSREAAVSVALDGDTHRCCNNLDCGNDWPCAIHPEVQGKPDSQPRHLEKWEKPNWTRAISPAVPPPLGTQAELEDRVDTRYRQFVQRHALTGCVSKSQRGDFYREVAIGLAAQLATAERRLGDSQCGDSSSGERS